MPLEEKIEESATKYQKFRKEFVDKVLAGRKPLRIKKKKLENLCSRIALEPVDSAIAKLAMLHVEINNSDRCDPVFAQFAKKLLEAQWNDYEFLLYMGQHVIDRMFISLIDANLFKELLLVTLLGLTIEHEKTCGVPDFGTAQAVRSRYWELEAILKADGYPAYLDSRMSRFESATAA